MPVASQLPECFIPDVPFHKLILEKISKFGSRIAMINNSNKRKYTFAEICGLSYNVATALLQLGFAQGDTVLLCLPNCPEFVCLSLGLLVRGCRVAPMNPAYTSHELKVQIENSRCCGIVTLDTLLPNFSLDSLPNAVNHVFAVRTTSTNLPAGVRDAGELLHKAANSELAEADCLNRRTTCAFLLSSSGTTGAPKLVMTSHYGMNALTVVFFNRAFYLVPEMGDITVGLLPFFHQFGLAAVFATLFFGATVVTLGLYSPTTFLGALQDYQVRIQYVAPPILVLLAKDPLVCKFDLTHLQVLTTGAAPVGAKLSHELLARHPNVKFLLQSYGMTECGGITVSLPMPKDQLKYNSCGSLNANCEAKVIDIKTSEELGANERGEVCVKTPSLLISYLNKPEAMAQLVDEDGWLHTGDIGYFDEDEQFFIIDRLKEVIKVRGFQVAPAELEDILLSHPEILDAAVVAVADPVSGELPLAFVVKAPASNLSKLDVISYLDGKVAKFKQLAGGVEFVDEIPKSRAGKILRRKLKESMVYRDRLSKL